VVDRGQETAEHGGRVKSSIDDSKHDASKSYGELRLRRPQESVELETFRPHERAEIDTQRLGVLARLVL
jgi:hypothetical protein